MRGMAERYRVVRFKDRWAVQDFNALDEWPLYVCKADSRVIARCLAKRLNAGYHHL